MGKKAVRRSALVAVLSERSERDIRLGLSERGGLCGLRRRDFGLEKGAKDRDYRRGCGYPGTETYHSM